MISFFRARFITQIPRCYVRARSNNLSLISFKVEFNQKVQVVSYFVATCILLLIVHLFGLLIIPLLLVVVAYFWNVSVPILERTYIH